MLVLSRKQSEMIQIGNNVVIKIIRTGRRAVKIGIEAPADVRVLRFELTEDAEKETVPAEDAEPGERSHSRSKEEAESYNKCALAS